MKKSIAPILPQLFLFISLFCIPGCIHRRHVAKQKLYVNKSTLPTTNNTTTITPPTITIWVHGTLVFYIPTYHQIFGGKTCLLPASTLPENHHFRIIADTISKHDPKHFPIEEFYIFGWSGKLQNQEREDAAQKLYQDLVILREKYQKKYGVEPTIRIIAHSHGGNVALNMARLHPPLILSLSKDEGQALPHPLHIKSLILLACPVQEKTMHLISTPIFNRVYSLYSSFDIVQILAPQFRRLRTAHEYNPKGRKYHYKIIPFSARLFPIYSHLTQAKIKINDYPISHTRFSSKEFVSLLPTILQKLDSWHDESLAMNKIAKHKLLCIYKK
jgi:hypothetical protein